MNVTNLDQVTFGVVDLAAGRRFWNDFGLSESRQGNGSVFGCRDGSSVVLRGHRAELTDAELSRNGQLVVTASRDHDARLWEVPSGSYSRRPVPLLIGLPMASIWCSRPADPARSLTVSACSLLTLSRCAG